MNFNEYFMLTFGKLLLESDRQYIVRLSRRNKNQTKDRQRNKRIFLSYFMNF